MLVLTLLLSCVTTEKLTRFKRISCLSPKALIFHYVTDQTQILKGELLRVMQIF